MLSGFYIATINIILCGLFSYYLGPIVKKLGAEFKIIDIPNFKESTYQANCKNRRCFNIHNIFIVLIIL